MASELRVNTLKDASGNNSVGMSTVSNGTPKAFCHFNQQTPAITTSFNTASLTDSGAGYGVVNWTSAMSNANYSATTGNMNVNGIGSSEYSTCLTDDNPYVARTASAWSFKSIYAGTSAAAEFDSASAICSALGDLA